SWNWRNAGKHHSHLANRVVGLQRTADPTQAPCPFRRRPSTRRDDQTEEKQAAKPTVKPDISI
ncbi:hypothetical protein, partial [Burkholderia ubonensis]|uniref:hypothetical protein n=1 Tax=Burkholderia ubonensis TaxID=101571 RepID=UPI001E3322C0